MLRLNLLQKWYAPANEALEDTLFDSQAIRTYAGIDLGSEDFPGATTILKFRHPLEADDLPWQIFAEVEELLSQRKLLMKEGTIVDASIISAPLSTKNPSQKRTPEMPQSKKGNQGYFGMKARIGVDTQSGLVHRVTGTAANVADIIQTHQFLHGEEQEVSADAGFQGVKKREAVVALVREGWSGISSTKRGRARSMAEGMIKKLTLSLKRVKAQFRAMAEDSFHVLKNIFRHRKTPYRELAKNTAQLYIFFALAKLFFARRTLRNPARP